MPSGVRRSIGWCRPFLVLILVVVERSDAGFTVTDLGAFGTGQISGATGVNAAGATSGTASVGGLSIAVESAPGGHFQTLNSLGLSSSANGINANGDLVGSFFDSADHHSHAFRTVNGLAIDLGSFSGAKYEGADSRGVAINASGEVLGSARLRDGSNVAFRVGSSGQFAPIALPGGSLVGQGAGLNDNGTAVGSYLNAHGISRVFVAAEGSGGTDLLSHYATSGFGLNSYASAINNRGDVTGYGDFNGQSHAFFVSAGGQFVDIGVTGGFSSSVSIGMNSQGQVVGEMDNHGSNSRAMLWDQTAGLFDLNTLLSPADQGWTLTVATGINDKDQISGQGYINGQLHGFLLTPIPGESLFSIAGATVPAPPSVWMAMAGLLIAGGWFKFKRGRTAARETA